MHDFWMEYRESTLSYKTISRATGNTIDGLGFISSSGYGDGGYTCYVSKTEDGKINAIRIEYITEDEEEWDEEEE